MSKNITYKGVKLIKPNNISMSFIKDFIDKYGKDYSFTIQDVVDFVSTKFKNHTELKKYANTTNNSQFVA